MSRDPTDPFAGAAWAGFASMLSLVAGAGFVALGWVVFRSSGYYGSLFVALGLCWMFGSMALSLWSRRFGLVACSLCALPPVALFGTQLARRLYYWIRWGGEAPDGMGSPAIFLLNWVFETPFTLYFAALVFALAGAWLCPDPDDDDVHPAPHRGRGGCE